MRAGIVMALSLAWSTGAYATPDEDRARALYQAGSQAYSVGKYDVAVEAFEAARELVERPALVFSLAQAYRIRYFEDNAAPDDLEKAVEAYRRYLELVPEGHRRRHAAQFLSTLVPLLEAKQLESGARGAAVRAPRLIVTSTVEGAHAQIDGGPEQPVPATFEVTAGQHEVEVSAPGYRSAKQVAVAVSGTAVAVPLNPSPEPALVTVNAPAGAGISVDERRVGFSPLPTPVELLPGAHQLVVSERGYAPIAQSLKLTNGERMTVEVELEPTGQRIIAWGLLGTSAALLVSGGVTTYLALDAESDAETLEAKLVSEGLSAEEYADYTGLQSDRDTWKDVTIGLGVGAAVVGAAGVLLWIFDNPTPPRGVPGVSGGAAVWAW